jgi:hypothetical protein
MSPAALAEVGVDPDVFTDALVLPPAWLGPGAVSLTVSFLN